MSERRSFSESRLSQAAVLGFAAAASGYAAKRVEDGYRYKAVREEVLPTLDRTVRRPEAQTRLALHEHRTWPLMANVRTREDMRERLLSAYTEWRHALETHPGAYQIVYQERALRADLTPDQSGETTHVALRVRAAPDQGTFVRELSELNTLPEARDIIIEHVQEDVAGINEHVAIEQGLRRVIEHVHERHALQAQDGPALASLDASRTPEFLERPSTERPNTIEFFDHPMTRFGGASTVAELHVSDMVIYVNNIRIQQVARSINGSPRTFRITADVIRDTGARFLSHHQE